MLHETCFDIIIIDAGAGAERFSRRCGGSVQPLRGGLCLPQRVGRLLPRGQFDHLRLLCKFLLHAPLRRRRFPLHYPGGHRHPGILPGLRRRQRDLSLRGYLFEAGEQHHHLSGAAELWRAVLLLPH